MRPLPISEESRVKHRRSATATYGAQQVNDLVIQRRAAADAGHRLHLKPRSRSDSGRTRAEPAGYAVVAVADVHRRFQAQNVRIGEWRIGRSA